MRPSKGSGYENETYMPEKGKEIEETNSQKGVRVILIKTLEIMMNKNV